MLTCSDGAWTGAPTFAYAWLRDGAPIGGQSASAYTVTADDVGHALRCRVTATNVIGSKAVDSSNEVVPTAKPAPTPSPGPGPTPNPSPSPVTPSSTEPKVIRPASVILLPSTKACVSRRSFKIRLRAPKGVTIASATVLVNGKKADVVKGRRLTAPVNLTGLPKGRFTVKVTITTATGRKVSDTRRYRTCAPKR